MSELRYLPDDWHHEPLPANVVLESGSHLETSYSFRFFSSERDEALVLRRGAGVYAVTTFDLGRSARLVVGESSMINGAHLVIDGNLEIGDHVLISWGVVIMDTYRVPIDPDARARGVDGIVQPVRIEPDVWIGFDVCILPGASIGRGAVVAARSVVSGRVDPGTVVAGNPAVPIRRRSANQEETS